MKSYLENILDIINAEHEALRGFIPICTECGRMRTESGAWIGVDHYMQTHTSACLTNSVCSNCMDKIFPMFGEKVRYFEIVY